MCCLLVWFYVVLVWCWLVFVLLVSTLGVGVVGYLFVVLGCAVVDLLV